VADQVAAVDVVLAAAGHLSAVASDQLTVVADPTVVVVLAVGQALAREVAGVDALLVQALAHLRCGLPLHLLRVEVRERGDLCKEDVGPVRRLVLPDRVLGLLDLVVGLRRGFSLRAVDCGVELLDQDRHDILNASYGAPSGWAQ
jgi:hypothetical protein